MSRFKDHPAVLIAAFFLALPVLILRAALRLPVLILKAIFRSL